MYVEIAKGSQLPFTVKITNENKESLSPSDLDEITMTCRQNPNKESKILFQKRLSDETIFYDEQGQNYVIKMLRADTIELGYKEYSFDIEVKSGDIIYPKTGILKITEAVTLGEYND